MTDTPQKLPTSPNEMPSNLYCDATNELRNILVTLDKHSSVELYWENDNATSNATGERAGEWVMTIHAGQNVRITGRHEDIEKVLWYVTTLAENADDEAWKKQQADRAAALAKLTPEDRKILRLNP